ncbi:hypothetical protein DV26_35015 [Amycolatopsis mediterranei]|uniref:Uncharacterized protein n=1 Tax=Amycolatopsis mediterranei (strain S699) TaxID=713604 RepID=A0A9R0NQU6_AMYMS|nr:hypothetical protein RAM_02120 [Amycolatopsis mediterranei S699]KDO06134.1 hypothetical protein DV26_35015 [Amycolatopsis mediterranei]KDU86599.1 hypothetical protein DV36_39960 [Amycolatopsis mediterranei]
MTPIGKASEISRNGGTPASLSRTNTKLRAKSANAPATSRIIRTSATRSGRPRSGSSREIAPPGRLQKATRQA